MSRAWVAVLVVVAASLSAAPAGAADPAPDEDESKSWWDRVKETPGNAARGVADVADRATDWVLPGDSLVEKAGSVMTGESPISPFHAANVAGETAAEGARELAQSAAEQNIPGYRQLEDSVQRVGENVPGGWRTVSLAGVALLLWLLFASGAPKNAARTAARQRFPVAAAYASGRKPPKAKASKTAWSHSGRPGKTDVVTSKGGRLEVCADSQRAALAGARRRFQGHQLRPAGIEDCDLNPEKVHVFVKRAA